MRCSPAPGAGGRNGYGRQGAIERGTSCPAVR